MSSYRDEVLLPRNRDEVFRFFADARNLEAITPKWLRFTVLTACPVEMRAGALIEYRLRIHGLPIRWTTEITVWEPPMRFVDEQKRGPYRKWVHEHQFQEVAGGTLMTDSVDYTVTGGKVIEWLFVNRDVRRIFEFRKQELKRMFGC